MRFALSVTAALCGVVSAAPAAQSTDPPPTNYENIDISDFYLLRTNEGQLLEVSFGLSGDDGEVTCSAENPVLAGDAVVCGESDYRFILVEGEELDYGLQIFHQLGQHTGYSGQGDIVTHCRTAGHPNMRCDQMNAHTIVIN